MTTYKRFKKIQEIGIATEVPWGVARIFREFKQIDIFGTQISFGEDFVDIEEAREALNWLVNELGGKATWNDKSTKKAKK